jgi:hypothetical protein
MRIVGKAGKLIQVRLPHLRINGNCRGSEKMKTFSHFASSHSKFLKSVSKRVKSATHTFTTRSVSLHAYSHLMKPSYVIVFLNSSPIRHQHHADPNSIRSQPIYLAHSLAQTGLTSAMINPHVKANTYVSTYAARIFVHTILFSTEECLKSDP